MKDDVEKPAEIWLLDESVGARKVGGQCRSPYLGFAMREAMVTVTVKANKIEKTSVVEPFN